MSPSKGGTLCTPGVPGWPLVILGFCIWLAFMPGALVVQSVTKTTTTITTTAAPTPDCDKVALTGQEGNLTFPGFFDNWDKMPNGQCRWTITVDTGYVIQLAFNSFYIDADPSIMTEASYAANYYTDPCAIFDTSIKIYDGQTEGDALLAKFCLFVTPWLITSTANSLHVVITVGGTKPGFARGRISAHYMAVPAAQVNRNCGNRTLSGTGGVIASPNFPNNYDNLLDCEWLITVDDGYSIQLSLSQSSIEYSAYCRYDSLQIIYSDNVFGPRPYPPSCQTYQPEQKTGMSSFTSLSNHMFIKFVTNWNVTSTGFNATWTRVCGSSFLSYTTQGIVQSPLYPEDYPGDQHCQYTFLFSKPGEKLVLTFNNFQLEQPAANGSCVNDYFEITSILPPGLLRETVRYCGGSLPPQFTSYIFRTYVRFVSNSDVSASGFQLSYNFYTADCGESLFISSSGTIHSPGYPGSFPSYIECTYVIRPIQGQTIYLKFDFGNWTTSECSGVNGTSLLNIFDGEGTAVTLIATNAVMAILISLRCHHEREKTSFYGSVAINMHTYSTSVMRLHVRQRQ